MISSYADRVVNIILVGFPVFLLTVVGVVTWSISTAARKPTRAVLIPVVSAIMIYCLLSVLPLLVEPLLNTVLDINPHHVTSAARLKRRFRVADLHCDVLLWGGRDFAKVETHPFDKEQTIGHVDLPRLRKGNVALQVFAIVNSVPRASNYESNAQPSIWNDSITTKAILERWSIRSWFSPKHRVLFAAERLHQVAARPGSQLSVVHTVHDLPSPLADDDRVHGILAVEGLSSLDNDLSNVDRFYEAGVRIMGPTHFHDTEFGGALSGKCKCGLTHFGREAAKRMKQLDIIIDLSHAHLNLMTDILDLSPSDRPALMVSHTGVNGVCNNSRNMDDTLLKRIADAGGIIGVTLFPPALCGDDLVASFVDTVKHVVKVTGNNVGAVALGSDWDGAVDVIVTAEQTDILAAALLTYGGFDEDQVSRILFDNALAFFQKSIPPAAAAAM